MKIKNISLSNLIFIFLLIVPLFSCKKNTPTIACDSIEVNIINQTSLSVIFIQINAGKIHPLSGSETLNVDVSELGYAIISANKNNAEFGWVDKEISSETCQPTKCIWKDTDLGNKAR